MLKILLASAALLPLTLATGYTQDTKTDLTVTPLTFKDISLGKATFKSGMTMEMTVGIGSGAVRYQGDEAGIFYTATDRGPNIKCKDARKLTGADINAMCAGIKAAKIFPLPGFTPTIYKFKAGTDKVDLLASIPLKGASGKPLSGLSNPLKATNTEGAYSADGKAMALTPNGFDVEGIVKLKDGSFWISEEYGGSIAHVKADGTVTRRLVPAGLEGDYQGADYPVEGALPALIMKRKLNRGIESLAISPDEAHLFFAMQSPLANPDAKAYKTSRAVRLFKLDAKSGKTLGAYLYPLDKPETFLHDNKKKKRKQSDVKVSEVTALGKNRLLVLERISRTTKFYIVDLATAATIPARFDQASTRPSLEQLTMEHYAAAGVQPLKKTLVFSTDDHKGFPSKIEGIALVSPSEMILVNDNDFGIDGKPSVIIRVTFAKPVLQ